MITDFLTRKRNPYKIPLMNPLGVVYQILADT